jgi:hypothetical protein
MRQFRRISVSEGTAWAGPAIRTVALIGDTSGISDLATYLPTGWRVTTTDPCDVLRRKPDVIVLTRATAADVSELCELCGDVPVVCTISPDAPASEAIAVLRAGADACVRSQGPLVLSAHIRACQRRRQARSAGLAGLTGAPAMVSALSGSSVLG